MNNKHQTLWAMLADANIVQGQAPELATLPTPWYVKCLLAVSGWLGAIFLLGFAFFALSAVIESPIASFVTSLPLLLIAYFILKTPNNEFFEHLALALSLSAQALFVRSVIEWESTSLIWLSVGLFQAFLVFIMSSFLHRVFSTMFAVWAFSTCLFTSQ